MSSGEEALDGQPVLLAATAGTARHPLVIDHAMRPLFSHLRALPIPTAVFAAPDDSGAATGVSAALDERIRRPGASSRTRSPVVHDAGSGTSSPSVPFDELLLSGR